MSTCQYCGRSINDVDGVWVDKQASGDDVVWRETCDANLTTFDAPHEPTVGEWRLEVEYKTVYSLTVEAATLEEAKAKVDRQFHETYRTAEGSSYYTGPTTESRTLLGVTNWDRLK